MSVDALMCHFSHLYPEIFRGRDGTVCEYVEVCKLSNKRVHWIVPCIYGEADYALCLLFSTERNKRFYFYFSQEIEDYTIYSIIYNLNYHMDKSLTCDARL